MNHTYTVEPVTRYIVLRDGQPVTGTGEYLTATSASRVIAGLRAQDAAAEAKAERIRRARAKPQKWTPASLREHLLKDPHWHLNTDYSDDPNLRGVWRLTWRALDEGQPWTTTSDGRQVPNYELYGTAYIATINDADAVSQTAQFALRDTSIESGMEWEYATIDRLAAALIRRGLVEV